jgi:hypothetical protein
MSYQFIHEESYARSAGKGKTGGHSVSSIISEALRAPGAHPHVEAPLPPVTLFGCAPDAVEALATSYAETVKDAQGRKLRTDSPVLLAGVVSAPGAMSDAQWLVFKRDAVTALQERYGERLRSVIEHTDEAHKHIHYYCVPLAGERFDTLATGRGAKAAAEAAGKAEGLKKEQLSKLGNDAYKAERREFQDWFFKRVGMKHGLARIGPGRRRLSRAQWQAEQQQASALKNALSAGADVIASANAAAAEILKSHDFAVSVSEEVEKRAQKVIAAEANLPRLRKKAELAGYAAGISRSKKVGEKIGTFVGAVSSTAKKWWYSVTKPSAVGKSAIDSANLDKQRAELISAQARIDKKRAQDSEQLMSVKLIELKQKLRDLEPSQKPNNSMKIDKKLTTK